MLNFDANVSLLWRELPFVERFQRARDAGFDAVEFLWPYGEDLDAVAAAVERSGVRVALHNMDGGNMAKGERGYANDPARRDEWRRMFETALALAARVRCQRMNCLPGNFLSHVSPEAQRAQLVENFQWAIPQAAQQGVTLLVEPLNTFDSPHYPYGRSADGLALIHRLSSPVVRLQYDVYHMTRMEGSVPETIRAQVALIGHIQIADDPGRHEPGSGRIDWRAVFSAIESSGYDGYVGLEYNPSAGTDESLHWLPPGSGAQPRSAGVQDAGAGLPPGSGAQPRSAGMQDAGAGLPPGRGAQPRSAGMQDAGAGLPLGKGTARRTACTTSELNLPYQEQQ